MFGFKKKVTEYIVNAPVNGRSINIEEVPDENFANKIMGDGVGFIFEENTLYAPCNAEIVLIALTKHAIGMKTDNGMEILVHVGVDTVNLNGQGFEVLVKENIRVKQGQPILRIDRELMTQQNIDLTTSMIITNTGDYQLSFMVYGEVTTSSPVMRSVKK